MSILDSLLRFIDPVQHREQDEERRRKREAVPPDVDGDEIELPAAPRAPEPQPRICRICGHRGVEAFCPACLAETMEPPRARRPRL